MSIPANASAGPVRIPVSRLNMGQITAQSAVRTASMQGRNLSYGSTSQQMNEIGLLGEHAVHAYLSPHAEDVALIGDSDSGTMFGGGDVTVAVYAPNPSGSLRSGMDVGIEVKTSRFGDWKRLGRVLNARQLERLSAKVIMWCVVADTLPTTSVIIMGWLPTEEVRAANSNESLTLSGQECLRVHEPMRAPDELLPWLNSLDVPPF